MKSGLQVVQKKVLRFVEYSITEDPAGESLWSAMCVSGDEKDCGAESKELGSEEAINKWMAEHCAATGHSRFWRAYSAYANVGPK